MKRFEISKEFLRDAGIAFENRGYRSCVSRAYYAVFHICIVLFEEYGYQPKNFIDRSGYPAKRWEHGIVIRYFPLEFVSKRRLFDWKRGIQLRRLYRTRIEADYRVEMEIEEPLVKEILEIAKEIITDIGRRLS